MISLLNILTNILILIDFIYLFIIFIDTGQENTNYSQSEALG